MIDKRELQGNIDAIRGRLDAASGRFGQGVTLCAVTKTVDIETVNLAYDCGVRVIGENRVQEALQKLPALNPHFELHIIGQLQTNKVKYIVNVASLVQSLDRIQLALEIDRRAQMQDTVMPVLVQVNIAREPQKAGVDERELEPFLRDLARLPGLSVRGLMAVMPLVSDAEEVRPYFRRMREWFERLRELSIENISMLHLSMGMSGDYLVAAEEGATMVRVGSAIFGHR